MILYSFRVEKDLSPDAFDGGTVRKIFKITSVFGNVACNPSITSLCKLDNVANFSVPNTVKKLIHLV